MNYLTCQNGIISTGKFPENAFFFLILTYIQQDATLHGLFYLETALHVSGGTITHHQERKPMNIKNVYSSPVQCCVCVVPFLLNTATCARTCSNVTLDVKKLIFQEA